MSNKLKLLTGFVIVGATALWCCNNEKPVVTTPGTVIGPNGLPQNTMKSCTLTAPEFNSWFASGSAAPNAFVKPANSAGFSDASNCNFYKWSEQMFLWITSRKTDGKLVMKSPVFYMVSPDSTGNTQHRVLMQPTDTPRVFMTSITQHGPHGLPIIRDKKGRMFEVEMHKRSEKPLVMTAMNKSMAVDHVTTDAKGVHTFFDAANHPIVSPHPVVHHTGKMGVVEEFIANDGKPVYLGNVDGKDTTVETESGQATGDVLADQNKSVVYYMLFVNNFYAAYLSEVRNKQYNNINTFPSDSGSMDSVMRFASYYGLNIADSLALAIELKTSWVAAASLPDKGASYITTFAIVPKFESVGTGKWIVKGDTGMMLAMVGMHVVGSARNHPEMIWATFEHQKNSPDSMYTYIDSTGKTDTVYQPTTGAYTFTGNPGLTDSLANISKQKWNGDTLGSLTTPPSNALLPTDVLRRMPWGTSLGTVANRTDNSAQSNSEVISLNNNIYSFLTSADVRSNYLLIGATWNRGVIPDGNPYMTLPPIDTSNGAGVGTNFLANSTMETFLQGYGFSCFTCHNSSLSPDSTEDLSHIFSFIRKPLPPVPGVLKK